MKKIIAVAFCALSIVLLITVIQKSGIVRNVGTQLAQVSYSPVPQTSPINPSVFFNFDGATPNASSVGGKYISSSASGTISPANLQYISGGPVGKFMRFSKDVDVDGAYISGGTGVSNAFTIEMMFKPGRGFQNTDFFSTSDGSIDIDFGVMPDLASWGLDQNVWLSFKTKTASGTDDFNINMQSGSKERSWSYWTDGNWHHVAFVRKADGTKEIWIDGTLPDGFSKTAPSGSLVSSAPTAQAYFSDNSNATANRKFYGDIDQLAIYTSALPGNMVKQHYDDFKSGLTYQNWTQITSVVQGGSTTNSYDPLNHAPGASLNDTIPYTTGITDSPLQQLKKFQLPRYKAGHGLTLNATWAGVHDQAKTAPGVAGFSPQVAQNAYDISKEIAFNFGHMISIFDPYPNYWTNQNDYAVRVAMLANEYPNWPLYVGLHRRSLPSPMSYLNANSQTLPADHFFQNASGQFLNPYSGAVSSTKYWRPASTALISSYISDGNNKKALFQGLLSVIPARVALNPTRAVDLINDNGELLAAYDDKNGPGGTWTTDLDPLVKSEAQALGLSSYKYASRMYANNVNQAYKAPIKSLPGIQDALFSEYTTDGGPLDRWDWSEARLINDPHPLNGQRYPTLDFYMRYGTKNWAGYSGAWHGWSWLELTMKNVRQSGDKYFSPFVAPGWNANSMNEVPPAMWLGLLKSMVPVGAEYFYTSYFPGEDYNQVHGVPETYTWQNTTAGYVQALTSRVATFFRNSDVMQGDNLIAQMEPNLGNGFKFMTQDPHSIVTVRKSNTSNVYMIAAGYNAINSYKDAVVPEKNLTIKLDGNEVTFKGREQGSVYMYDNTNTSAPVFYQLDAWHEATHPSYWSKNFLFDAELYDTGTATIKTTGYVGRDFTQSDSYVNANGTLGYTFQPRVGSGTTFYLWARAKTTGGSATLQANVDGGSSLSTTFNSGAFQWVKLPGSFSGVTLSTNHTLNLVVPTGLDLDKFYLTPDAGFVPPVTSTDTTAPSSPTNLASSTQTSNSIDLTWTASTDNVGVVGYDVYSNSTIIASSSSNAMTLTNLTPSTMYTLSVKARDAASNVSNASASIQVSTLAAVDTQAPSVPTALTSSGLTHNAVNVSWTASTDNVGVTGYMINVNGVDNQTVLTSTSYSATGLTASTAYAFKVKARDAAGNWSAYSSVLNVTTLQAPDVTNPTGSITVPSSGVTLSGTTPITVSASDVGGLNHIDFYRSTNTQIGSVVATGTSGSFTYQWNTSTVSNGSYDIYAKIYDNAGNVVTTTTVSVTVNNVVVPPPDTTDPVVSMTSPVQGATVSGSAVALVSIATDNVGVTKVEFYRSGNTLITTDTTGSGTGNSTFDVAWNTTLVADGVYSITAKAYDAAGNITTSGAVSVTVSNAPPTSPTVSITSPSAGSTVGGTNVNLVATVNSVVTSVMFYKSDNTVLGTGVASGSNAFTFVWNSTSAPDGNFTFYAKAYDVVGNIGTSASRTVSVNNFVTFPSNVTGLVVTNTTSTSVSLSWNPSTDPIGLIGYDVWKDSNTGANRFVTGAPGTSYTVTGLTPNTTYFLGVHARNSIQNISQVAATVTVTTSGTDTVAPTVSIVSPAAGTKFEKGTTATFTANASDNVGVTKVEFWLSKGSGGATTSAPTLVCTDTTSPYTCDYLVPQTLLNPYYNFSAKAFDEAGNKKSSDWVWIRAKN